MPEPAAAYRALRARVCELAGGVDDHAADARVPATPEWSVHDLLAHLAGVASDILAGRLEGVATDPWTQAQVDARRDRSVAELVAEWRDAGGQVDGLIPAFPPGTAEQLVFDASTHEQDLRHALGAPGARDSDAIDVALGFVSLTAPLWSCAPWRVETDAGEIVFGDGEPVASARTTRFELLRATTGRRSAAQIAAWSWDGEPRPDLVVLSPPFTMRAMDLDE
jgi:uncharacterized protein (TIGR03083 family)